MLSLALAGCISGSSQTGPDADKAVNETNLSDDEVENLTKNSTIKTKEDVQFDPDSTVHAHDYWKGREQVQLVQETIQIDWERYAQRCATSATCHQAPTFMVDVPIDPNDPTFVYPGTGSIDVTLAWSSSGLETVPNFRPEACVSNQAFIPNCQPSTQNTNATHVYASSGDVWTIDKPEIVNRVTTDPPHALKSNWRFAVRPCNDSVDGRCWPQGVPNVGMTEFTLTATIHRSGEDLPVDPPHFAFYGEQTELKVLDGFIVSEGALQNTLGKWWSRTLGQDEGPLWRVTGTHIRFAEEIGKSEQPVIPFRTDEVRVELSWETGQDVPLGLKYRSAADGWQSAWRDPSPEGTCGSNCLSYTIRLTQEEADSPYALKTQWEFGIFHEGDDPRPMTNYQVTLDVTAHRAEV